MTIPQPRTAPATGDHRDERRSPFVEYALLVALVAVVCIVSIALLGGSASTVDGRGQPAARTEGNSGGR